MRARSAIYVPGDHNRALAKAGSLMADVLIFDLEDGVAPTNKPEARTALIQWLASPRKTHALALVRINHHSTPDFTLDINALSDSMFDGIMLSKVSGPDDIDHAQAALAAHQRTDLPIWCNVETALGIKNVFEIAAHPAVRGLVAGTNDLANDLRLPHASDRSGLIYALQRLVLASRAHKRTVLDGTFIDLYDEEGLRAEAQQGRTLGFDGKTLIHPKQIAIANAAFSPSKTDLAHAQQLIEVYETAMQEHKAVTLLDGKMIEALHYERAKSLLNETLLDN